MAEFKFGKLADYAQYVHATYQNFPKGRYVSVVVVRKTEGETIFRTEGSGEGLVKETVIAGIADLRPIRRIMISKRKQTAVERRTGRELLREHNLLFENEKKTSVCALNTNQPCGKCIDCLLYGYAVGGGGAQKSRVMTDDSFSIAPVAQITATRTFNATFDDGTMRDPVTKVASASINSDEYVKPETHFLDIETLKDVTLGELQYVIANILRSSRYGAITSRMGKMRNTIVAIVFSDCELFSNLELTQQVYDALPKDTTNPLTDLDFPLADATVQAAVLEAIPLLLKRLPSRSPVVVTGDTLNTILAETVGLFQEQDNVKTFLEAVQTSLEAATAEKAKGKK